MSFGVNDTTADGRVTRVAPERSVANLRTLLADAAAAGLPALVVGPPPVADGAQNRRIAAFDERLAATAAEAGAPYVPVFAALRHDTGGWTRSRPATAHTPRPRATSCSPTSWRRCGWSGCWREPEPFHTALRSHTQFRGTRNRTSEP